MNNNIGVTNNCNLGCGNSDSLILILFLLLFLTPGTCGGCGNNDSLFLILILLVFLPNFNRGFN